jgi:DNA-binding transcriptional LysR family regulator
LRLSDIPVGADLRRALLIVAIPGGDWSQSALKQQVFIWSGSVDTRPCETILWPALSKMLPRYPEVKVELAIDYGFADIVAERFDAGVRLGEQVAKDMIALRIGPDMRMAVVGAPSYFAKRPKPKQPQELTAHDCINLRMPTRGGVYVWEFEKRGRELNVRVEGQLVFSNLGLRLKAALAGHGLAYLPEDQVLKHATDGRLIRVLDD